MPHHLKVLFICTVISAQVYAAEGPSTSMLTVSKLPQSPRDAHELLSTASAQQIFSLVPHDPEESKELVLRLIKLNTQWHRAGFSDPACYMEGNEEANICGLCERFDLWDRIDRDALMTFDELRTRVLDAAVRAGNSRRISDVAQVVASIWSLRPEELSALAVCFKEDPKTLFMPTRSHKTLIGRYIYDRLSFYLAFPQPMQEFIEVCNLLNATEFAGVISDLFQEEYFKVNIWSNRAYLSTGTHPHLILLQNIIAEMNERFERWNKLVYLQEGDSRLQDWLRGNYRYNVIRNIYTVVHDVILRKHNFTQEDCAVLLETCRSFYAGGEYDSQIGYWFNYVLQMLAQYGIKPNTRLFPHDHTDKRMLISEWLLTYNWEEINYAHARFEEVVSLLTEQEFDAVIADMEGRPKFYTMLKNGVRAMEPYECYEGVWEGGENIKLLSLKKLNDARLRAIDARSTLFGRLYIALAQDLADLNKPSVDIPRSYGYAYPSPTSPIYFKGTVFERDEIVDDSAAPGSSTDVVHQEAPAPLRRQTKMKRIKDAVRNMFR